MHRKTKIPGRCFNSLHLSVLACQHLLSFPALSFLSLLPCLQDSLYIPLYGGVCVCVHPDTKLRVCGVYRSRGMSGNSFASRALPNEDTAVFHVDM